MKLKKKINNTVQILTHVKEKLKFVGVENEKEKESLAFFDDEVKRVRTFESKYLKAFLSNLIVETRYIDTYQAIS